MLLAAITLSAPTSANAQEVKRPERMEGAGVIAPTSAASSKLADAARLPGLKPDGSALLPNQWSLDPAGRHLELGDFPVHVVVHPGGRFAAVLHCGHDTHEVVIVTLASRAIACRVSVPQAFYGLCFSRDGNTLYASGGEYEVVHSWRVDKEGLLSDHRALRVVPVSQSFVVAGLSISRDGKQLFACGAWGDRLGFLPMDAAAPPAFLSFNKETYPYASLESADGSRLFVSLWGGASVAVVDPVQKRVEALWKTPSHPTEMALSPDGLRLFVACANSNLVAVLDTSSGQTLEVITSALFPKAPSGSTPNSLALSPDGSILLVANADNNNLAVFNVSKPGKAVPMGFIPTGWYPTSVRFDAKGNILVASGKGLSPKANRQGPQPGIPAKNLREYIGGLFNGTLSFINFPTPDQLRAYTAQAYACSPLREDDAVVAKPLEPGNPIPAKLGAPSPIKHCIYIIKENRTYDQVFGDIKAGNGDPSICIFPERVTPNLHALAREFVLLDNFYVESEVSADGHEWTMGAYATDFVERTWPLNYRKQPKNNKITYPSEGNHAIAVPAGGYLWDRCKEAGVSYISYGEWVQNGPTPDSPGRAKSPALEGHIDPLYRSFDVNYSDLKRADRFIAELGRYEKEGDMPRCVILRLPNDHTAGTKIGALTPTAMVAQNDLAVGRVIEALSNSRFWQDTAVFIVEDDAQNGSDHVDAHRTTALVISPWTKRRCVDSSLYSTSSMLRTMELILGLQPMSQFDAAALPMYASFSATPDPTPFKARPARVDLENKNVAGAWGAETSDGMDLATEDAADDLVLNEIVWKSVRGEGSTMPAPVRAAFVFRSARGDDKDDAFDDDDGDEK
jgi:DNA-binding beta-propeller fold protein YncE